MCTREFYPEAFFSPPPTPLPPLPRPLSPPHRYIAPGFMIGRREYEGKFAPLWLDAHGNLPDASRRTLGMYGEEKRSA